MADQRSAWQNILFWLGIIFITIVPVLFLLNMFYQLFERLFEQWSYSVIFFLMPGTLLVVFSRLEEIREIELFGLKAKIHKALDEAYATLEQVKGLAKVAASTCLSNTVRSGWIGGLSDEQQAAVLEDMQKILRSFCFTNNEIKEITEDYHHCILSDYRNTLLGGGRSTIPKNSDNQCIAEWKGLRRRDVSPPVPPSELRAFFDKYKSLLTDDINRRLDGYEYYFENHAFLDWEDFKKREDWSPLDNRVLK